MRGRERKRNEEEEDDASGKRGNWRKEKSENKPFQTRKKKTSDKDEKVGTNLLVERSYRMTTITAKERYLDKSSRRKKGLHGRRKKVPQ